MFIFEREPREKCVKIWRKIRRKQWKWDTSEVSQTSFQIVFNIEYWILNIEYAHAKSWILQRAYSEGGRRGPARREKSHTAPPTQVHSPVIAIVIITPVIIIAIVIIAIVIIAVVIIVINHNPHKQTASWKGLRGSRGWVPQSGGPGGVAPPPKVVFTIMIIMRWEWWWEGLFWQWSIIHCEPPTPSLSRISRPLPHSFLLSHTHTKILTKRWAKQR